MRQQDWNERHGRKVCFAVVILVIVAAAAAIHWWPSKPIVIEVATPEWAQDHRATWAVIGFDTVKPRVMVIAIISDSIPSKVPKPARAKLNEFLGSHYTIKYLLTKDKKGRPYVRLEGIQDI